MEMIKRLEKNRSYRRFGKRKIQAKELCELIRAAGLTASAGNLQKLRFVPVCGESCKKVFPHLRWAGYLPDWQGPAEGERPTGYMILLCPTGTSGQSCATTDGKFLVGVDVGIAAQSILLTATDMGLGGCMLASIDRPALTVALGLDATAWEIALVIALGEPREEVRIVGVTDGNIKYYRDAQGVHYVPKRSVRELTVYPHQE